MCFGGGYGKPLCYHDVQTPAGSEGVLHGGCLAEEAFEAE